MTWTCACGIENGDKNAQCAGCGWLREATDDYLARGKNEIAFKDGGFLKKGQYEKIVYIADPVTDEMALSFIRNDINVCYSEEGKRHFHFTTHKELNQYSVHIYYSSFFVGKYHCSFMAKLEDEQTIFSNAFVSWMVKNSWK